MMWSLVLGQVELQITTQSTCYLYVEFITGSSFRSKDIHHFSWISPDGVTQKEIDHILVSMKYQGVHNCHVYRMRSIV